MSSLGKIKDLPHNGMIKKANKIWSMTEFLPDAHSCPEKKNQRNWHHHQTFLRNHWLFTNDSRHWKKNMTFLTQVEFCGCQISGGGSLSVSQRQIIFQLFNNESCWLKKQGFLLLNSCPIRMQKLSFLICSLLRRYFFCIFWFAITLLFHINPWNEAELQHGLICKEKKTDLLTDRAKHLDGLWVQFQIR